MVWGHLLGTAWPKEGPEAETPVCSEGSDTGNETAEQCPG